MGVDVCSMMYVGIYLEGDAEEYLVHKGLLKEGELEDKYGEDIGYMPDCPVTVQEVSRYSHEGYYVGYEVRACDYQQFDTLIAKFKELTGDIAEVHTFTQWS